MIFLKFCAPSAMGKSTLFANRSNCTYDMSYMSKSGQNRNFGVLDGDVLFVEADWSTNPVKLSDIRSVEDCKVVFDLMVRLIYDTYKSKIKVNGEELRLQNVRIIVFVGHWTDKPENSAIIIPSDFNTHLNFVKDHWTVKIPNHGMSDYYMELLKQAEGGLFRSVLVEPGIFLDSLFKEGILTSLARELGGLNV